MVRDIARNGNSGTLVRVEVIDVLGLKKTPTKGGVQRRQDDHRRDVDGRSTRNRLPGVGHQYVSIQGVFNQPPGRYDMRLMFETPLENRIGKIISLFSALIVVVLLFFR